MQAGFVMQIEKYKKDITKKKKLLEAVHLLSEAVDTLEDQMRGKEVFLYFLADSQKLAICIGEALEHRNEDTGEAISLLEEFCEGIYSISRPEDDPSDAFEVIAGLRRIVEKVVRCIEENLPTDRREVVFLPYKASMWDSLETVWEDMVKEQDTDVYVVPIPYYDKNLDGSFGEKHYEGGMFPENVKITDYRDFDLEKRHPEVIYIHNPYDDGNYVTSIEPAYYSSKIKNYTDCLVYIPYFVLGNIDPDNAVAIKRISHFCVADAVIHAHKTVVQSETVRKIYINVLTEYGGEASRPLWESKIEAGRSPKHEKLFKSRDSEQAIPEEWKKVIFKTNGERKKIIFYNTSVSSLLKNSNNYIAKLKTVLKTFYENKDDVALLWRPHPLLKATINSMRPHLQAEYDAIVSNYKAAGWGIYDDTSDVDRAVLICDAYFGDPSSVVELCRAVQKPVMIQDVNIIAN